MDDKHRNDELIKIIGIFDEDKWYPIIWKNVYDDIFQEIRYYEYEDENISSAESMIKKIKDRNDFWLLPSIFKYYNEKRQKDDLLDFIKLLPESIKKKI